MTAEEAKALAEKLLALNDVCDVASRLMDLHYEGFKAGVKMVENILLEKH